MSSPAYDADTDSDHDRYGLDTDSDEDLLASPLDGVVSTPHRSTSPSAYSFSSQRPHYSGPHNAHLSAPRSPFNGDPRSLNCSHTPSNLTPSMADPDQPHLAAHTATNSRVGGIMTRRRAAALQRAAAGNTTRSSHNSTNPPYMIPPTPERVPPVSDTGLIASSSVITSHTIPTPTIIVPTTQYTIPSTSNIVPTPPNVIPTASNSIPTNSHTFPTTSPPQNMGPPAQNPHGLAPNNTTPPLPIPPNHSNIDPDALGIANKSDASSPRDAAADTDARGADSDDEDGCAVCMMEMLQPVKLPCNHVFCFLCLKGITLHTSPLCPMCRGPIPHRYLLDPRLLTPPAAPPVPAPQWQWFYEGRNGWWRYDPRTSAELEEAFASGRPEVFATLAGICFRISVAGRWQQRADGGGMRRAVKRDAAQSRAKGTAGLRDACVSAALAGAK